MKKSAFGVIATVLGMLAVMFVSTASVFFFNQPKVPQELLKK